MSIIIGLGTGRSGTASLAKLINAQDGAVCFHEINPLGMGWSNTPGTVSTMLREFQSILDGGPCNQLTIDRTSPKRDAPMQRLKQLRKVTTIGEIGFYYLSYVEQIMTECPSVKFPCLRRFKGDTVQSYINKMQSLNSLAFSGPLRTPVRCRNHWVEHSGEKWVSDEKWDKCYPKFPVNTLEDALSMYWDSYYDEAERLSDRYEQFQIFELDKINSVESQRELLTFCGFTSPIVLDVHENRIN